MGVSRMGETIVTVEPNECQVGIDDGRVNITAISQLTQLHVQHPGPAHSENGNPWATLVMEGDGIDVEIELAQIDAIALVEGLMHERDD